jgi:hypothetical protein
MKKRMEEISMEIRPELITISQFVAGEGDHVVEINPDQLDLLISWLEEAKVYCNFIKTMNRSPKKNIP